MLQIKGDWSSVTGIYTSGGFAQQAKIAENLVGQSGQGFQAENGSCCLFLFHQTF